MDSEALILGGLAAGAVVLLLRRKQQQQNDLCSQLCGTDETCKLACNLGTNALGWLADQLGNGKHAQENSAEVGRRDAINKQLNGAVKVALDPALTETFQGAEYAGPGSRGGVALQGDVLEFGNGCVPFAGAPGWEKCAPGTQSMWYGDTCNAVGACDVPEQVPPAFPDAATLLAYSGSEHVDHSKLLTGSTAPGSQDAATQGPFPTLFQRLKTIFTKAFLGAQAPDFPPFPLTIPDGSLGWFVRGEPVVCPAGTAPAMWAADGSQLTDDRVVTGDDPPSPPPCVPGGRTAFSNQGASDPCPPLCGTDSACLSACRAGQGMGSREAYLTCQQRNADPTWTWVPPANGRAGYWDRTRPNRPKVLAPCGGGVVGGGKQVAGAVALAGQSLPVRTEQ